MDRHYALITRPDGTRTAHLLPADTTVWPDEVARAKRVHGYPLDPDGTSTHGDTLHGWWVELLPEARLPAGTRMVQR